MPEIVISEFMADNVNSAFVDEDGAHEDWMELQNLGSTTVSLNGWYLTDEAGTDAGGEQSGFEGIHGRRV